MGSMLLESSPAMGLAAVAQLSPESPGTEISDGLALDRVESNLSTVSTATFNDAKSDTTANGNPDYPVKTDKPRPHVCTTCGRSFARLEHLKRHERSHTKEKPFECPECTRCFARRDLLLRHQQKLHMSTAPSSKPKGARRDSSTALGPNGAHKIRKGSMVGAQIPSGVRPRANTISHIDGAAMSVFGAPNGQPAPNGHMQRPQFNPSFSFHAGDMSGLHQTHSSPHPGNMHGNTHLLPRIATQNLQGGDPSNNLHTAPPGGGFGDFDQLFSAGGSTINPAQLHVGDAHAGPQSPFNHPFGNPLSAPIMEEEDGFDWMRGFNAQMNFAQTDSAIEGSSPSAMSNGSGNAHNMDMNAAANNQANSAVWQQQHQNPMMGQMGNVNHQSSAFGFDTSAAANFGDFGMSHDVLSGQNLQHHVESIDGLYGNGQQTLSPHAHLNGLQHAHLGQPMQFGSDVTSISSASLNSAGRHSSITSVSTDSITDVTRQALLMSLAQPSAYGHRSLSQPPVSSPLSPRNQNQSGPAALPSTFDLQRYVNAYIRYFHPHFPFLHIPTLSFDSPIFTSHIRATNGVSGYGSPAIVGGGGCLILGMSAIGALYEGDRTASKELFEASKKMIQVYLEERRKADAATSSNSPRQAGDMMAENTPLWLVQSMLLNVVYGHQCGDKIANDIASTHCIALVSLARAADLTRDVNSSTFVQDIQMGDDGSWTSADDTQWRRWISAEERKRTLFAIFHMSSLLVSAYNHAPALMNSEIQLDLPCDEDLWNAESAQAWAAKGGIQAVEMGATAFAHALSTLLSASQGSMDQFNGFGQPMAPQELKPSTFGCLVLINALHNYIWETRQRHSGRRWTTQETDAMHAHIEPALRAWQSAWASNTLHSLERPNPFGMGPLSADSIPLLDLAYVRLFVNLGSSKEALWQRDFDAMAEELARGSEIVQHADYSDNADNTVTCNSPEAGMDIRIPRTPTDDFGHAMGNQGRIPSSKRERHLRKAALYAADSMSMSEKLGVTYADFTSRELPVQSAICAFDCAQVLAEWVATVQERVGRFLGILGRDHIDFTRVPAMVMLEEEDVRLLEKINDIIQKAESKMQLDRNGLLAYASNFCSKVPSSTGGDGYGSMILLVTAVMLERGAVWPVQTIMSQGLTVQATHLAARAEMSLAPR